MTDISNPEQLRRQTLNLLRFPLAIVVMLIHIWPSSPIAHTSLSDSVTTDFFQFPILSVICTAVTGFLRGQSVPIYFFIAGYVFFYNVEFNQNTYIKKLKNRTRTLLIPYIIWNTIALLIIIARPLISATPLGQRFLPATDMKLNISLKNILNCYWNFNGDIICHSSTNTIPIDGPLWFIRDLMIIVLITPILYQLIKRLKHYFVVIVGLVWLIVNTDYYNPSILIQISTGLFFFSYGAYMSIHKLDMLVEFGRYFKSSIILYPFLGILYIIAAYCYPEACSVIKRLNIVAGLLFAYNLSSWLLRKGYCRISPFLASSAFFIYVSHTLVVNRITKLQEFYINPDSDIKWIWIYLITSIISTSFLLGVFYLLRRYSPSFLGVIIGRK